MNRSREYEGGRSGRSQGPARPRPAAPRSHQTRPPASHRIRYALETLGDTAATEAVTTRNEHPAARAADARCERGGGLAPAPTSGRQPPPGARGRQHRPPGPRPGGGRSAAGGGGARRRAGRGGGSAGSRHGARRRRRLSPGGGADPRLADPARHQPAQGHHRAVLPPDLRSGGPEPPRRRAGLPHRGDLPRPPRRLRPAVVLQGRLLWGRELEEGPGPGDGRGAVPLAPAVHGRAHPHRSEPPRDPGVARAALRRGVGRRGIPALRRRHPETLR